MGKNLLIWLFSWGILIALPFYLHPWAWTQPFDLLSAITWGLMLGLVPIVLAIRSTL